VVEYAQHTPSREPASATLFDVLPIRHALADIGLGFRLGRLLSYRVAWMQSKQMIPNYEASMAKTFGTELHQRLGRVAINSLGLPGQLSGDTAPLGGSIPALYLSTVSLTIAAGTSEINRNIIAQRGLGMPRG
jgi:3-oxocholest-4-en-26-oyl-CoA dehydrogenase alpha subunit